MTREWAPCFLAARREGRTFAEEYAAGLVSANAKRVYEAVCANETLPLHAVASACGFHKEEKAGLERALVELQMKLYLTMCGRQRRVSRTGEEYGWFSTMFCTTERFWGEAVFDEAARLNKAAATARITKRVLLLNPKAAAKKIAKFISG